MWQLSKSTWLLVLGVCAALWVEFFKKGNLCASKTDLTGKTVVITGANNGIGFETALGLAKRNARVIIACRNEQKAKKAVEDIKKSSGKVSVDYMIVDFAELADIRRAVEGFLEKEDRLDILINNAATVTGGKTRDGFDMMLGVNHLGYFMLTNLLMPLMRKTAKKSQVRIINVSSEAYYAGNINFKNLNPDISVHGTVADLMLQYSNTKLMNIYFTSELDVRLKKEFHGQQQAITAYSLHPGTIYSNIGKDLVDERGIFSQLFRYSILALFAKPTVYGAQTTLCCALEENIEGFSGSYFVNMKPEKLAGHALHPRVGSKLWSVSEELTGVKWEN